jgi:hypothetical protein
MSKPSPESCLSRASVRRAGLNRGSPPRDLNPARRPVRAARGSVSLMALTTVRRWPSRLGARSGRKAFYWIERRQRDPRRTFALTSHGMARPRSASSTGRMPYATSTDATAMHYLDGEAHRPSSSPMGGQPAPLRGNTRCCLCQRRASAASPWIGGDAGSLMIRGGATPDRLTADISKLVES